MNVIEAQPIILVPIGLIFVWIGLQILWDNIFRPLRINKGVATASFNGILGRTLKFIFIEDRNPAILTDKEGNAIIVEDSQGNVKPKLKYPKFGKIVIWRNFYLLGFALTIITGLLHHGASPWIFAVTCLTIATRASKVFAQRYEKLQRMFEVASVNLSFPRDADLNPWQWIRVLEWKNLTQTGEIHVHYPAKFKGGDQALQRKFETHFNDTITKDNTWVYEWKSEKSMVAVVPVPPIPTMSFYPGSAHRKWNEIPLGVTAGGEAIWDVKVNPHALLTGSTGAGKSTLQRNIIAHCIQFPNEWRFVGIDVKRVELSPFKQYEPVVMGVALDVPDGTEIIRYAKEEMMARYDKMEKAGVTNFADLPEKMHALMIMVDETYMFLATSGNKTDEGKEEDALKGEASKLIGEIARLGRAAGVHIVLATQRPDATVIYGELKQNLAYRIAAGRADTIASQMTLDSDEATKLPGLKGRGYYKGLDSSGEPFQGYYAPQEWIDRWLAGDKEWLEAWKKDGGKSLNQVNNEDDTTGFFGRKLKSVSTGKPKKKLKKVKEKKVKEKKVKEKQEVFSNKDTIDDSVDGEIENLNLEQEFELLEESDDMEEIRHTAVNMTVDDDDYETSAVIPKPVVIEKNDSGDFDPFDSDDLFGSEPSQESTPVKVSKPVIAPTVQPKAPNAKNEEDLFSLEEDDMDSFGNINGQFSIPVDENLFSGFDLPEENPTKTESVKKPEPTKQQPSEKPVQPPSTPQRPVRKTMESPVRPPKPMNGANGGTVTPKPVRPPNGSTAPNKGASGTTVPGVRSLPPRPQRPQR